MRALTILTAFVALGTGFVVLDRLTAPARGTTAAPASAESLGLSGTLLQRLGLSIDGIVLAPESGEERDFRGIHSAEGRLRPVYGRVRVRCTDRAVGPSCWEISYLEIDGREVAYRVTAIDGDTEPREEPDENIETADTETPQERPTPLWADLSGPPPATGPGTVEPASGALPPKMEPDPAEDLAAGATGEVRLPAARPAVAMLDRPVPDRAEEETDTDPVRKPTHSVDRPIINARVGPGIDSPVVARLAKGLRLSLIDTADEWGRFVVLDGIATGREVWAALHIVKALP